MRGMNRCAIRRDEGETISETAMLKRRFVVIATIVGAVGALTGGSALLFWPDADNWTEEAKACVANKYAGYWESSGKYSFKLDYENGCDRKVSCAIDVQINNAQQSIKQHGVLVFAPRGQTPTTNSYSVPVTSLVGSAQADRNCRFV
ncbi:hypothetical protein [Tardiphaga sp.]|uniref:hypothetical protein n=1 Tax=Tardiphaga sp. TaxID=1926292 RepID=UPI003529FD1E